MSDNVKLFVGNLPLDATHEEINKLFEPYGEIGTCSLLRQYAFITLKGEGAADRAIRYLDGKEYRGRPLVVEESRARPPNSTKVFVGNLSATCTADDLHGLFQTFGRVLDCDKVKARLCSNAGYAFVHMERKEDAVQAIEGLNGTVFKGRQLSVELSKAQPLNNLIAAGMAPHEGLAMGGGPREGLLPRPAPSLEHHQSQAAVLAAAAAAAAGLPIQVQQSVHNSFYNTTAFDPTYAALKGLTAAKGPNPAIYGALASQVYGTVADQVYQDSTGSQEAASATPDSDHQGASNPTALFEAARAKFFQQGQKVLAEQQAGRKVGPPGGASDRDRSPIRGGRGPLLPDPVPGSAPQIRGKRRALLPTPPGGPEDPAAAPTATETPAASEATDPIARCYAEYYQQMQQYQNYQQYQQQYQYLQYAYTNPPPPPPPPPPSAAPPPSNNNNNNHHHANHAAAPAPPGTYSTDSSTTYAPPVSYASSAGGYDVAAAARGYSAETAARESAARYEQQQQQQSSGAYGNSYDASGNYDAAAASANYDAAATGNYDASSAGSYASAYASTGGYAAAPGSYSAASRAYEQQTPTTTAHGQSLPQQRHEYPYHHTPEPPYR